MSIQENVPLSEYTTSSMDVLMPYYPYFALCVVVIAVISIFYMRWIIRQLKEGLRQNPKDEVLLWSMKRAKFRQFMNYGMLVIIGVGTYFLTHIDSFLP